MPPVEDSDTAMVWRRAISFVATCSAIGMRSFMAAPLRKAIRVMARSGAGYGLAGRSGRLLVGLVRQRVPDHADEILGREFGRRPFGIEIGERFCRHHVVL